MLIPGLIVAVRPLVHEHDETITRSSGTESSAESIPSNESIASTAKGN